MLFKIRVKSYTKSNRIGFKKLFRLKMGVYFKECFLNYKIMYESSNKNKLNENCIE